MPPQHGKSQLTSRFFPAWFLGTYPDKNVILGSYNGDFASEWGREGRDLMEQFGRLWGLQVRKDSNAASRWRIRGRQGGMKTVGRGGSVTGRRGDLFIIDDPFNGPREANSPAIREQAWEWYKTVARTRMRPDGAMVVIQTRWHEDDLAGRIIRRVEAGETEEHWERVDFPAIAEGLPPGGIDALGRVNGEALWPEVYDEEHFRIEKKEQGPYNWSALYQQKPIPLGGGFFKRAWLRYYRTRTVNGIQHFELVRAGADDVPRVERVPISICTVFSTVDLGVSGDASSDYTVVATYALTPKNDLILLDVVRVQEEGPEQVDLMQQAYMKYRGSFVGVESVAYQMTAVQHLARRGVPVRPINPGPGGKEARALIPASRMQMGTFFVPDEAEGKEWVAEWVREHVNFPRYKYDDQVDTTSYAAQIAADGDWTGAQDLGGAGVGGGSSYWQGL